MVIALFVGVVVGAKGRKGSVNPKVSPTLTQVGNERCVFRLADHPSKSFKVGRSECCLGHMDVHTVTGIRGKVEALIATMLLDTTWKGLLILPELSEELTPCLALATIVHRDCDTLHVVIAMSRDGGVLLGNEEGELLAVDDLSDVMVCS